MYAQFNQITNPQGFANETTTSNHMMKYAISKPTFLAQTALKYRGQNPLTSFLAERNYIGTSEGSNNIFGDNRGKYKYTRVGSREIQWPVETPISRKGKMLKTALCDAYPVVDGGTPGRDGTPVTIYLDTNWYSPKDVLELADNKTYVYIYDERLPREVSPGIWAYNVKVVSKDAKKNWIPVELLQTNSEVGVVYNMFEELSETAYEKYSFGKFMRTFTTIMRFKYSISGTASQMDSDNPIWVSYSKGSKQNVMWMTHQEDLMMNRYHLYRERFTKWGQGTINEITGESQMRLENGMEIIAGDGLMNQGDAAWEMPCNKLTKKFLDSAISNIKYYQNNMGELEMVLLGGRGLISEFQEAMENIVHVQPEYVDKDKKHKGVNVDFDYYKYGGIKIFPIWDPWYDDSSRPGQMSDEGLRYSSYEGILLSVGERNGGIDKNVELLALGDRDMIHSQVFGANKNGQVANSVDGQHDHVITEFGVALKDPDSLMKIYRPRKTAAFVV
jgi:hypothetical protein